MTKHNIALVLIIAALGALHPAAASPDDEGNAIALLETEIPTSWGAHFQDEETLEAHKGERIRKFCLDDDFLANPNAFESEMVVSRDRSRSGTRGSSMVKKLRGGVDFVVVGENAVIISLPVAGDHLVETRGCKRNLYRTKFIRFTDSINRTYVNRCVQRRRNLSIQTRMHKSGFKGCEIVNIYEWNGPVAADELEMEFELPPIELK